MRNNFLKKILLIFLNLTIIAQFIIPNYSYSAELIEPIPEYDEDETVSQEELTNIIQSILDTTKEQDEGKEQEEGGVLFTPISQFILGIADGVMSTLQATFIGDEKFSNIITANAIKEKTPGNNGGAGVTLYRIKYSPAVIFSGRVAAFDINFFSPLGDENGKVKYYKTKTEYIPISQNITYEQCKTDYGATNPLQSVRDRMSLTELLAHGIAIIAVINAIEALANTDWDYATYGGGAAGAETTYSIPMPVDSGLVSIGIFLGAAAISEGVALADRLKDKHLYYMQWQYNNETYFYICDSEPWMDINQRETLQGSLYKVTETKIEDAEEYEKTSTAYTLRPIIATWYIALRNLALIGLLSVLLYIGIRIIISSTAQDKAKYKKMLLDWFTAVLILFVLHYIMVFIINVTQKLTDIFTVTNISVDGTDKFITNIRNMATGNNNESYFTYFGYVIMYIALTILTIVFTIQYIKRLVFIAFLTMIAPLIALTYPIDRIKDGQAQAFSMWIREYVFNCLLQPIHLLLYTIFIGTASELVNVNPVYAIIVLAFFTPAEKFFRRMFGFEKATSLGTIGAAAGGAMLMNMMNKLQGKAKYSPNNTQQNIKDKVRTVKENINDNKTNNIVNDNTNKTSRNNKMQDITGENISHEENSTNNSLNLNNNANKGEIRTSNKTQISGVDKFKSAGRWTAKAGKWATNSAIKLGGALGGATVGLAAGVASGDLGDTAKYTGAGAIAGANITSGINNRIQNQTQKAYENYKQRSLDKKISRTLDEENSINDVNNFNDADNIQKQTEKFVRNGITDTNKIKMAVSNGIVYEEYEAYEKSGVKTIEDMVYLKENGITDKEYKEYADSGIKTVKEMNDLIREEIMPNDVKDLKEAGQTDMHKVISVKQKHPEYSNEGLVNMFKLAKHAPKTLPEFKNAIVNRVFNGKKITEAEAEKIYDSLCDFF